MNKKIIVFEEEEVYILALAFRWLFENDYDKFLDHAYEQMLDRNEDKKTAEHFRAWTNYSLDNAVNKLLDKLDLPEVD